MMKKISSLIAVIVGISMLSVGAAELSELKSKYESAEEGEKWKSAKQICILHMNNGDYEKAVEFGKQAYNETGVYLVAWQVIKSLQSMEKSQEAFDYGMKILDEAEETPGIVHVGRSVAMLKYDDLDQKEEGLALSQELSRKFEGVWTIRDTVGRMHEQGIAEDEIVSFILEFYPDVLNVEKALINRLDSDLSSDVKNEAVETLVSNIDIEDDENFNNLEVVLQDELAKEFVKPHVATLFKRHVDQILSSDNTTPEKFNQAMDLNKNIRIMCSESVRKNQWERIKNAIPLSGSFSDWKSVAELCKWKVQELQ